MQKNWYYKAEELEQRSPPGMWRQGSMIHSRRMQMSR
jgi:hypothetical protein